MHQVLNTVFWFQAKSCMEYLPFFFFLFDQSFLKGRLIFYCMFTFRFSDRVNRSNNCNQESTLCFGQAVLTIIFTYPDPSRCWENNDDILLNIRYYKKSCMVQLANINVFYNSCWHFHAIVVHSGVEIMDTEETFSTLRLWRIFLHYFHLNYSKFKILKCLIRGPD